MEEHGRKKRQNRRNEGFSIKNFSMGNLIRDGSPLEDKSLAGREIQRDLVVENQAIGKNQPDRNKRKGLGRIIVFEWKKQMRFPYLLD